MKSIKKVAKENKKSTFVTVLTAIIFIATLFVDQNEIFGLVSTEIVKWVSFIISMLTGVLTYLNANLNR